MNGERVNASVSAVAHAARLHVAVTVAERFWILPAAATCIELGHAATLSGGCRRCGRERDRPPQALAHNTEWRTPWARAAA